MLVTWYYSWDVYSMKPYDYSTFPSLPEGSMNIFGVFRKVQYLFVILINFLSYWADGNGTVTQTPDPHWHNNQTVSIFLTILLAWFTDISVNVTWNQVTFRDYYCQTSPHIDCF